jgi:hypothetical protein
MHVTELRTVALIKNQNNALFLNLMLRVLQNKIRELLNRGDNNARVGMIKLFF